MISPVVQIRQQYAKIGIDADPGKLEIRQPRPDFQITTRTAKLDTKYNKGELIIDQSPAWEALGKGSVFQFTDRVASEAKSIALEGTARRAQEGNQLAAIQRGGNAIAEIAYNSIFTDFKINYEGPFGTHNFNIEYTPRRPDVNYEPSSIDIQAKVNPPEINYTKGKLDIYLLQKPFIEFIPPQIDIRV